MNRKTFVFAMIGAGLMPVSAFAAPSGRCPNGKDSSCPTGCVCTTDKVCRNCPDAPEVKTGPNGRCFCKGSLAYCRRTYGANDRKVFLGAVCG